MEPRLRVQRWRLIIDVQYLLFERADDGLGHSNEGRSCLSHKVELGVLVLLGFLKVISETSARDKSFVVELDESSHGRCKIESRMETTSEINAGKLFVFANHNVVTE